MGSGGLPGSYTPCSDGNPDWQSNATMAAAVRAFMLLHPMPSMFESICHHQNLA